MKRLNQPIDIEAIVADGKSFAFTGAIKVVEKPGFEADRRLGLRPEGSSSYVTIEYLLMPKEISSSFEEIKYQLFLQRTEAGQQVAYFLDEGALNTYPFGELALGETAGFTGAGDTYSNEMTIRERVEAFLSAYGNTPDEKATLIFQRI